VEKFGIDIEGIVDVTIGVLFEIRSQVVAIYPLKLLDFLLLDVKFFGWAVKRYCVPLAEETVLTAIDKALRAELKFHTTKADLLPQLYRRRPVPICQDRETSSIFVELIGLDPLSWLSRGR
jgi:hypothetical protein